MSQIYPQYPNTNRKSYLKVEKYEKEITNKLGSLEIFMKVVFDNKPKRIGKNQIGVPKGFYKILNNHKEDFQRCFYYENDLNITKGDKLKNHELSCKEVLTILK